VTISHPLTVGTPYRGQSHEATGGPRLSRDGISIWLRQVRREAPAPLDIALRFRELADKWHDETDGLSSPSQITGTQSYLDIVALGRPAVPHILRDLETRGGFWYPALLSLTREWPVPEDANGIPRRMKAAWLAWGRQHGYVT